MYLVRPAQRLFLISEFECLQGGHTLVFSDFTSPHNIILLNSRPLKAYEAVTPGLRFYLPQGQNP